MLLASKVDSVISEPWQVLNDADEWSFLTQLRNRMIHRSNVPQTVTSGAPPPDLEGEEYAATSSTRAFNVNEVAQLETWLASTVQDLLTSAIELLRKYP